ncbi:hypothetical protein [Avibacterium avium]|uniref:hypothetical protein n=1 Tax=Avibacterium avium TaxID=751 RepID=UPI003BF7BB0D
MQQPCQQQQWLEGTSMVGSLVILMPIPLLLVMPATPVVIQPLRLVAVKQTLIIQVALKLVPLPWVGQPHKVIQPLHKVLLMQWARVLLRWVDLRKPMAPAPLHLVRARE